MIYGLGCDVVNIQRLEKTPEFLEKFQAKIMGKDELTELAHTKITSQRHWVCILAKHYAGKEAFAKALGTGFRNGVLLKDVQILHDKLGKPYLQISGAAAVYLRQLAEEPHLHVNLSDDYPCAMAVVSIDG